MDLKKSFEARLSFLVELVSYPLGIIVSLNCDISLFVAFLRQTSL